MEIRTVVEKADGLPIMGVSLLSTSLIEHGSKGLNMAWDAIRIWKDQEERLWTLADSGIDAEIFEMIGEPVYDEATGIWFQQIALRSASD